MWWHPDRRAPVGCIFSDVLVGCYSITVSVDRLGNTGNEPLKWWLTSLYGPQEDDDKVLFLEELEAIRDACQGPWALTGDFNLILSEADKSNDRVDRANLRRFRRTVAMLECKIYISTEGASHGATNVRIRRSSGSIEF
jgi:hypothetical protein